MTADTPTADTNTAQATGPRTDEGKRVAARNATTHGLFARDVVLPHLGEDPAGYTALLNELTAQVRPKNLLDQHYVEKIAAASWRLRRLHRWQAQLFEAPELSEDEALARLDRVMRHETALHRQIDASVKMLGRDVPHLFKSRIREEQMAVAQVTERDCKQDEEWDWVVANNTREQLQKMSARPLPLDEALTRLDAAPLSPASPCQEEVARLAATEGDSYSEGASDEATPVADGVENCQNELAPSASSRFLSHDPARADPEGEEVAEERGRRRFLPGRSGSLTPQATGCLGERTPFGILFASRPR